MPQLPDYKYTGLLDCTVKADTSQLKGKSVIVTGGAKGLGAGYVRAFANAGAYVTIGDVDEASAQKLVAEFPNNVQVVKCDVTNWEDQLALFKAARISSPFKSCDIVIANAGIGREDQIFNTDESDDPPKPDVTILDVNLLGVMYTTKLALHYFKKQEDSEGRDRCLILQGSLAGYIDQPRMVQYNASKFAVRGMMRTLRRTGPLDGIRVNLIAPWYIRTDILGPLAEILESKGIVFAESNDAARAVLRIAADRTVAGRSLAIVPRKDNENGFLELEHDHYEEGSLVNNLQNECINSLHSLPENTK